MVHWFIDPFFEGTPVKDAGGRYKKKVDETKKKREDRLEAQRKRNREKASKKVKENLETVGDFLFDDPSLPFAVLSPVVRPVLIGAEAATIVAPWLAEKTIEAGGVGALELYTPEIRRYEETALVGMGGMII
jgi:hypothetical protein